MGPKSQAERVWAQAHPGYILLINTHSDNNTNANKKHDNKYKFARIMSVPGTVL